MVIVEKGLQVEVNRDQREAEKVRDETKKFCTDFERKQLKEIKKLDEEN